MSYSGLLKFTRQRTDSDYSQAILPVLLNLAGNERVCLIMDIFRNSGQNVREYLEQNQHCSQRAIFARKSHALLSLEAAGFVDLKFENMYAPDSKLSGVVLTKRGINLALPFFGLCREMFQSCREFTDIFGEERGDLQDESRASRFHFFRGLVQENPDERVRRYRILYDMEAKRGEREPTAEPLLKRFEALGFLVREECGKAETQYAFSVYGWKRNVHHTLPPFEELGPERFRVARCLFRTGYPLKLGTVVCRTGMITALVEAALNELVSSGHVYGKDKHPIYKEVYYSVTQKGLTFYSDFIKPVMELIALRHATIEYTGNTRIDRGVEQLAGHRQTVVWNASKD